MQIRLLILVRDSSWYGGVVNFITLLKSNLSDNVCVDELRIGQRKQQSGRWLRPIIPLIDMTRLAFRVFTNRYDVIHINPSLNKRSLLRDALFMLVFKIRMFTNIIIYIHGWEAATATTIENNVILRRIFCILFGGAPVIYVLAGQFKRTLVDWGVDASRVQVVTTMFDGKQFNNVARSRIDDEIHLLFLSRFVKEKGVYELLIAFDHLSKRYSELRLIMAGNGPEEDGLHKWVNSAGLQNKVVFTGYIRDQEKAQVLMDSDIFVFPTYYGEGCPVSLLEAMAAGLPVVTTTAGGIGDFITDMKNGRLISEVSPDTVESAIQNLLDDRDGCISIAEYNKKVAWENYEAVVVTRKIEKTYLSLAKHG